MRKIALGAIAILFLGVSTVVYASAPARTPDELINNLMEAAHKGDLEGFLSGLTEDSRKALTEAFSGQASLRQAQEAFQKALDERFGKAAKIVAAPPEDLKAALGRLAAAEVMSQKNRPDGSVALRVKTTVKTESGQTVSREDTLIAQREGGAWRLALGLAADGRIAAQRKAAAERITLEVRSGKYKDRLSAMLALAKAWTRKEGSGK